MKLTNLIYFVIASVLSTTMLFSCSDDMDTFHGNATGTSIVLMIPDVEAMGFNPSSRADETTAVIGDEGKFNTLWLYAYPDGSGTNKIVDLSNASYTTQNRYRVYNISIDPGTYRFYLLSNIDPYIKSDQKWIFNSGSQPTETDIKAVELDYASNQILINDENGNPKGLPMAALPEDIVGNTGGSISVVQGQTNTITANLKFLCSKIRYSILFDNSENGISSSFRNNIIEFITEEDPYIKNIIQFTKLDKTPKYDIISTIENNKWSFKLDKYEYPDHDDYPLDGADYLVPWNESAHTWATSGTKSWQYTVYLPENLNLKETGNQSEMNFPYSISGVKASSNHTFSTQLQRAQMYDIVSRVTRSDFSEWDTHIKVSGWDLMSLFYLINGPVELIVENSKMDVVKSGAWRTLGFNSNVPDDEIWFEYPTIRVNGQDMPLFTAQVITKDMLDDEGLPYAFDDEWQSHLRIRINQDIPYKVLAAIDAESYTDESGKVFNHANIDDLLKYFHIVAGNIHKRIDIDLLEIEASLNVTPLRITIDTRELFMSGGVPEDGINIDFFTNYDISEQDVTFTLEDTDNLVGGYGKDPEGKKDDALKLILPEYISRTGSEGPYTINSAHGQLKLMLSGLLEGNTYWNESNEYTLTFSLTVPAIGKYEATTITRTVIIEVKPFTTNYTIHFRDNTKPWAEPHIYVYQLLTLPSDMTYPDGRKYEHAGKIVGYIERNPSSGLQWNGAVQYVFSNNLSFKGWAGYGGPSINDPWAPATCTYDYPDDLQNSNKSTMGFVMFGQPDGQGFWNYTYAYNVTGGIEENSQRKNRYNYDFNFNEDHQKMSSKWPCGICQGMNSDYNGGDDNRFYPGIAMEREADGWWKYTLTGVAQPGRTMIIFANWHEPWGQQPSDYAAEDYRWPGDYETGLPLFDFEDNDGWFLFDGNTTNADQQFYDDKPAIIPHNFTTAYANNMRIEVKMPAGVTLSNITVNDKNYSMTSGDAATGKWYIDLPAGSGIADKRKFDVKVSYGGTTKTYTLRPKNFKLSGNKYITAQPLYWQFEEGIRLFVKWNDNVNKWWYYQPQGEGNNHLNLYWGSEEGEDNNWRVTIGSNIHTYEPDGVYGNYKNVTFSLPTPPASEPIKDKIILQLGQSAGSQPAFRNAQTLSVEDLPKFYNPSKNFYQINWHYLNHINWDRDWPYDN